MTFKSLFINTILFKFSSFFILKGKLCILLFDRYKLFRFDNSPNSWGKEHKRLSLKSKHSKFFNLLISFGKTSSLFPYRSNFFRFFKENTSLGISLKFLKFKSSISIFSFCININILYQSFYPSYYLL